MSTRHVDSENVCGTMGFEHRRRSWRRKKSDKNPGRPVASIGTTDRPEVSPWGRDFSTDLLRRPPYGRRLHVGGRDYDEPVAPPSVDVSDPPRRLFILDGHSLAYRAFFALPSSLATTTGQV